MISTNGDPATFRAVPRLAQWVGAAPVSLDNPVDGPGIPRIDPDRVGFGRHALRQASSISGEDFGIDGGALPVV